MKMTIEMAKRILERPAFQRSTLTDKQRTEILMDWLEGMTYKAIQEKHGVSKSAVTKIVSTARKEAKECLERIAH